MITARTFGIVIAFASLTEFAFAQAVFVNLSDKNVFVARYTYQPSIFTVGSEMSEGWNFSGWRKIEPGESYRSPAGTYYVESGGSPVTWKGLETSVGFVKDEKFNVFVPRGPEWSRKEQELLRSDYKKVSFQKIPDGVWRTSENKYRLTSSEFPFEISSRSAKIMSERFSVPGPVAYHTVSSESWGAKDISWTDGSKGVTLGGIVEGAQKRPGGPREPGYIRGKLTIYYTVPR